MSKRLVKNVVIVMIVTFLLSACSFGETKIEYERLVKALDEGDKKTVILN
ncbi:hypothetical protein AN402_1182 [Bacillus wiedmannii]|nr:hypothetical protein AN402_1182 [Bacillus wiedmannii]